MGLSLGSKLIVQLAQNWWLKDRSWHKSSTCFFNRVLSQNCMEIVVSMLRLNQIIWIQHIWFFLFPNIDISSSDLSNLDTILFYLHILCWSWWFNNFPYLHNCSLIDTLLEIKIQFDSWWYYALFIRNHCCFTFLARLFYNKLFYQLFNKKRCCNAFVPSLVDLVRCLHFQSSIHLLIQRNHFVWGD
jgi:hypothetical protein